MVDIRVPIYVVPLRYLTHLTPTKLKVFSVILRGEIW